ncbi:hypothetical protein JXA47_08630 [Candidatus Sumerlaeota bacterium]|nr:hypothetical protein [Candidatus Sumerlaeota bacterium]
MPVKHTVLQGGHLVAERYRGAISHEELISHVKEILLDSSIAPRANSISDCRFATFPETTAENIHELSDLHGEPENRTSFNRLAIVISGEGFSTARMFEAQVKKYAVDILVFSGFDVACAWLGIDPGETLRALDELGI